MSVLNRRMFQEGGAVGSGPRILFRKPDIKGYRDPKTVGYFTLEFENGKYYDRYRDADNNLVSMGKEVDTALSPTRDPKEAYLKTKQNQGISLGLSVAPIGFGTGLGLSGLGFLGAKTLPYLAKATSPVMPALQQTGKAVKGIKGFQPRDPYDPLDYTLKFNPTGATISGLSVGGTQVPKLYAQPVPLDTTDPDFIQAQYAIIQDPEASQEEKNIARDLINQAIAPDIQGDLDALAAQETQEPEEIVAEVADEMKDDVEAETPELSVEEKGKTDINKEVDKRVRSDAKLLDFSNDRFLSAIRNIGASLVAEGQMGSGLAKGATAFAEEQAAKDLMREQAELEKQAKMEELLLEASLKGDQTLSPSDLKTLRTFGSEVSQNVADFQGGQAALAFMDTIIEEIENAPPGKIGGFQGWLDSMGSKLNALLGTDVPLAKLGPQAKIEALARVVQQGNLQAILGESGRTISDKDRTIVVEVFGTPGLFDNRDIALEKLRASRNKLRNANVRRKSDVQMTYDLIKDPAFGIQGKQMALSLMPSLQALLNIDPTSPIQKGDFEELINISLRE